VGQTQGRGRQDRANEAKLTPKKIFMYPLRDDWQAILCEGSAPLRACKPAQHPRVVDWAEEEFGNCQLGDNRLTERVKTMARDFFAQPTANLPQACGSRAKTKAAYRFLDHQETTLQKLLQPHYASTERRMAREQVVLAVQDTTEIDYTVLEDTEDLGPIGNHEDGAQGLLLHDTLAINVAGTPLGLIDIQCWRRDPAEAGKKTKRKSLTIDEKESNKWLKSYRAAASLQKRCPGTMLVSMGDREADIYELFHEAVVVNPNGPKLLIRAVQNRRVDGEHRYLWGMLEHQPCAGVQVLRVPRRSGRTAREAHLEIRFAKVTLKAPANKKMPNDQKAQDIDIYAVLAKEVNTDVKEPLKWLLLTTVPVENLEDATERLAWYTKRWGIEVYHRTLKSGCRIENRQLCTADRLETCVAIDLVVAWRIYHMTKLSREVPGASALVCFEDEEWKALWIYTDRTKPLPDEPPTLIEAVRRVAGLGGFLGRKCDGQPGTQSIWRGIERLSCMTSMYVAMTDRQQSTRCSSIKVHRHGNYG
jgi:hypothetical protein